jgi:hypothetical protein
MKLSTLGKIVALSAAVIAALGTAYANHSWGGYHWARTSNPFTLALGDNVSTPWDAVLGIASSDWSKSTVLNTYVTPGAAKPRNCRPTSGRVEVCNTTYGQTGWLGVAQIWASSSHITQGTVKLNDTYFNTPTYNTADWRQLVACQEVGHTFGLAHQDENFNNANLGTCMDYTNNPSTNTHPNQHDYDMLVTIYTHLDSFSTVGGSSAAQLPAAMQGRDFDRQSSWGQMVKRSRDGAREIYVRDFGQGHHLVTHVFWALEEGGPAHRQQRANED